MARMIPTTGPQDTNSRGEREIYKLLKQGLSDEFTVIRSLPWLARGVKELDPSYAPTGEMRIPRKLDTCSAANWTVVPAQTGQLFQTKLDTLGATARG